jgi:DNA-binding winged helix-turn-helix (wHTH) protein
VTTLEQINPLHKELAKLRDTLDMRDAELANYRDLTAAPMFFPAAWKLDPTERALLSVFMKSKTGFCRRALLRITCTDDDDTDEKIVDVRLCHLRAKLKKLDVQIETINSEGFRLMPGERAKVEALMQEEVAAPKQSVAPLISADLIACAFIAAAKVLGENPEHVATKQLGKSKSRLYAGKVLMRETGVKEGRVRGKRDMVANVVGFKAPTVLSMKPDHFNEDTYGVVAAEFKRLRDKHVRV